jgi:hypothetical protein
MTLLAPLFLAGLAALAIPVLIHLIQRERKNIVRFPSLMFVRRIPYSSIRRRRIHNWALLLMRLAALTLIVAAFARPLVRSGSLAAAAGGAREVVILLDRSYSMGHGDQWARARRAAAGVAARLGEGDRGTLVLFDEEAAIAVQPTSDRVRLESEINAATLSAATTAFGPALKLAGSLLAASSLPRREVALVSDFQHRGWSPGEGLRLPAGTTVTPIPVQAADARNLAATPVTVQREQAGGQDRVVVTAGVLNRGDQAASDVSLALELDGHVAETARVSVQPHGSASVTLPPVVLTSPFTRGVVRIGEDDLARDNAFYFVLSPPQPVGVAVVGAARSGRDAALYLTRALSIGDNPRFEVSVRQADELSDETLARSRVVIVNEASPTEVVAARLARFVEQGGGLLVVYGPQTAWPSKAADLLPALPAGTVDRMRGPAASLGGLEYGHAVFEPFRAPRSGDFSAARFYGYRSVTPAKDARLLARFDDGAPAVLERSHGRGRVALWTSTLDLYWNDLPLKPVYLPFVHQMARHLADYRERAAWATVGQVLDLAREGDPSRPKVALTPDGERRELESERGSVLRLDAQGFYEVREQGRQAALVTVAAANVELGESDRTAVDPAEIVAGVAGGGGTAPARDEPQPVPDELQERSQRLWWYILFAGILLLTGESLLAHRLSRASA